MDYVFVVVHVGGVNLESGHKNYGLDQVVDGYENVMIVVTADDDDVVVVADGSDARVLLRLSHHNIPLHHPHKPLQRKQPDLQVELSDPR